VRIYLFQADLKHREG